MPSILVKRNKKLALAKNIYVSASTVAFFSKDENANN